MLLNLSDDAAGQDDTALAGGGFGWREKRRLAASLGELAADAEGCCRGIDVAAAESDELAPAQATETGKQDHGAVAGTAGVGEGVYLSDGEQRPLW